MNSKIKAGLKKSWQIFIIILLAVTMTFIFQYAGHINENKSTDVLSQLGSRGTEVRNIQNKLKKLGYYTGTVDGIYGSGTRSAVIKFQKNCGLTADGIAGPKTLLYLGLGSSSASSNSAYSSNDVYLLAKVIAGEAEGSRIPVRSPSARLFSTGLNTRRFRTRFRV